MKTALTSATVKQQLAEISKSAHDQMRLLNKYLLSLIKELRAAGIYICRVSDLSEGGRRWLEGYYQEEIFPVAIIRKKFSRY